LYLENHVTDIEQKPLCECCDRQTTRALTPCSLCGRLICYRCRVMHDFLEPGRRHPYCPVCWDVGLRHRKAILALEARLARDKAQIIEEWLADARKLATLKRLEKNQPGKNQVLDLDD